MAASTMSYLILGGVLAGMVVSSYAIQCHECQKMAAKECSDDMITTTDMFLTDCDDDYYCVKYKTIVKLRDSGYITGWERHSTVETRTCEPMQGKKEGCTGWQNNGGITIKCWCGSDGCNPARSLQADVRPVFLLASLALLFVLMAVRNH